MYGGLPSKYANSKVHRAYRLVPKPIPIQLTHRIPSDLSNATIGRALPLCDEVSQHLGFRSAPFDPLRYATRSDSLMLTPLVRAVEVRKMSRLYWARVEHVWRGGCLRESVRLSGIECPNQISSCSFASVSRSSRCSFTLYASSVPFHEFCGRRDTFCQKHEIQLRITTPGTGKQSALNRVLWFLRLSQFLDMSQCKYLAGSWRLNKYPGTAMCQIRFEHI